MEDHWKLGDAKGGYLCTNNGLRALLQLFRRALHFVVSKGALVTRVMEPDDIVDSVTPYITPVIEFFERASATDVGYFRNRGSSLQSVDQNCYQMMAIVNETFPEFTTPDLTAYMNSRDLEGTKQAKEMIDTINDIVFRDVISVLQSHYGLEKDAWWLKGVPAAIRNACDQQYNANTGDHERWRYLYFINYYEILLHGQNWDLFKDYYNFYGKGKKADLIRWISRVNKARTVTHHAEKGPLSKKEIAYVRIIHQLVKVHIDGRQQPVSGKRLINEEEGADTA